MSGEGSQPQVKKNQNANETFKTNGLHRVHRSEVPSFLRRWYLSYTPQIGTLKKRGVGKVKKRPQKSGSAELEDQRVQMGQS